MKIKLSSKIIQHYPGLQYIVILIKNVNNLRKISSISQLLRGTSVVAKNELKKADRKDLFARVTEQEVEDGATFLESYLLSSKVKKIQNGKDLEGKNNLVNLVNLISLKYFLPLHGFDLDQAEQDYLISFYQAKKGKKSPELEFLPETKHLAIWFPNLAGYQDEELDRIINDINAIFAKYLNAQISEVYHLNSEHLEIDLEYVSEKETEFQAKQSEIEANAEKIEAQIEGPDSHSILAVSQPTFSAEPATPTPDMAPTEAEPVQLLVKDQLKELLIQAVSASFAGQLAEQNKSPEALCEIEIPADHSHGDYASNIAMKLTKIIGKAPQEIAQQILLNLPENQLIEKADVVGPGFLNFHLKPSYFQEQLQQILTSQEHYGRLNLGQNKRVMIEFGSLNMAKPFGAHHFLSTIIGQTLVNLYRVCGYQVLAADFPGDWGTQFGKTLYAFKHWGEKEVVEKDPMNELLKLYVRFHQEAELSPSLEDDARAEFQKLAAGDSENLELWKWIIEASQRDIDQIYKTVGVHHDCRYPESKYNQNCEELLEKGKQLGIFTLGEKGAFVVNFEEEKLPTAVIQKSDGTTLYITRDLASIQDRLITYPDLTKLVYVVDVAQSMHFQQLFATAQKLHQSDSNFPQTEFKHVVYGRMSFADSGMSTRKGNIVLGRELIKDALEKATTIIQEKSTSLGNSEQKQVSYGVAIGAIKYAMICQAPESDFTFDWDKVLAFEGNSAPYLQYTQARANSIIRKSTEQNAADQKAQNVQSADQVSLFSIDEVKQEEQAAAAESTQTAFGDPHEQALLRLLPLFPEKIAAATMHYKPNILTTYLYQLAQTFNSFYAAVPVLKTKRPDLRDARLKLVQATAQVLKNGLNLVGIATFEKM